jgi:fatty-acyl-CoA synthase
MSRPVSLFDRILATANKEPARVAMVFTSPTGDDTVFQSQTVIERSLAHGVALAQLGIRPGDVVLLALEQRPKLVTLFLGAIAIGAIPCIFPSPTLDFDPVAYAERLLNATAKLGPSAVIVENGSMGSTPAGGCRIIEMGEIESAVTGTGRTPPRAVNEVAFLQLTSGSTGRQRAVPMKHATVLASLAALGRAWQIAATDTYVGWSPLHHGMGLGLVIRPLVFGASTVLIPRLQWLAHPVELMQAIDCYRGTIVTMPNFALNYCVQRIADRDMEGLDLSSWRILCAGAEQNRGETLASFAERFARWGFRRAALATGYGLTEGGVVTRTTIGREPRVERVNRRALQGQRLALQDEGEDAATIVSCGRLVAGVELQIRSETGTALRDRNVGEVVVRSDRIFAGYHGDAEGATESLRDGWLYTGDLGYMAEGELFICGRLKNIIIVGGANVSAEDVEAIAASVEGLTGGRMLAFGAPTADRQSERIVLVCEFEGAIVTDRREVELELRRRVKRELDVTLSEVRFVPPGWIVKTSSGKLARSESRSKWDAERIIPEASLLLERTAPGGVLTEPS